MWDLKDYSCLTFMKYETKINSIMHFSDICCIDHAIFEYRDFWKYEDYPNLI